MLGVANLVKKEGKSVKVPSQRIVYEEPIVKTPNKVVMKYVFDDYSEAKVCYTKTEDFIIERKSAIYDRRRK